MHLHSIQSFLIAFFRRFGFVSEANGREEEDVLGEDGRGGLQTAATREAARSPTSPSVRGREVNPAPPRLALPRLASVFAVGRGGVIAHTEVAARQLEESPEGD